MSELTNERTLHVCVDMQRMFAEPTDKHAPWLLGGTPCHRALVEMRPARTVFTRFLPPSSPADPSGAWKGDFTKWSDMTPERLPPDLVELLPGLARHVPPARVADKAVYSPWFSTAVIRTVRSTGAETLIVTGGETDASGR